MRPDTDTDTEGIPPASTREAEDARAATSHADHPGAAALLDAPVWCHHDERADAEGDGGTAAADNRGER